MTRRLLNSLGAFGVAAILAGGCSTGTGPVAGGGGTDWEARTVAVVGIAVRADGTPASGAVVRFEPDTFRAQVLAGMPKSAVSRDSAVADVDGWFRVDAIDTGVYSMEVVDSAGAGEAFRQIVVLTSLDDSVVDMDTAVLAPTGSVSGSVSRANVGVFTPVYVRVLGLSRIEAVDTAGSFTIPELAPSTYVLEFFSTDPAILPATVTATVTSESTLVVPTVQFAVDQSADLRVVRAILDSLGLNNVPLSAVSSTVGGRVVDLNLSLHAIPYLPADVGRLTMLRTLWVSGDSIHTLPDAIGNLKELTRLSVNNSALDSLPNAIQGCVRLRHILAMRTNLTTLPDSIGNCQALDSLEINDNLIADLPETITRLVNLSVLNVSNNRICNPAYAVRMWLDAKMPGWSYAQTCP